MINEHSSILNYLEILEKEAKFKAKAIYTLTCIHNYLSASSNQVSTLHILSKHHGMFRALTTLHSDALILEQVTALFSKFEIYQICPISTTAQFLDHLISLPTITQTELTDSFFESLTSILHSLRHDYSKTKELCIKLTSNKKIKPSHQEKLVEIVRKYSHFTMEDCIYLNQLGVRAETLLNLMWIICGVDPSPQNRISAQKIITDLLNRNWQNEVFKYKSMMVAIACSMNEAGSVQLLFPPFINAFYLNTSKPFFPAMNGGQMNLTNKLEQILEHFAREAELCLSPANISLESCQSWFPQLNSDKGLWKLLEAVIQNKQIPVSLLRKHRSNISIFSLALGHGSDIIQQKLASEPTPYDCFVVFCKLLDRLESGSQENDKEILPICLLLWQFYLTHKEQAYLGKIEMIISSSITDASTLLPYTKSNPNYILFLPMVLSSLDSLLPQQYKAFTQQIDGYLSSEQNNLSYQFYLAEGSIRWRYKSGVGKFVNFLLRKLNKERLGYEQIYYYLRKNKWEEHVAWLSENFEEQMESILERVFVKLVDEQFKEPKLIVFGLQRLGIFKEWSATYRWALNPLDESSFNNAEAVVDSLEVFETVIQHCENIPFELIKRFFTIVAKNWGHYTHLHMFTIERIADSLFKQQLSTSDLQAISVHLKSLCNRSWQSSNQIYKSSFELLIKTTLMQQSEEVEGQIIKQIRCWLMSQNLEGQPYKSYANLKQTLFCLEVLVWVYQYGDEPIDNEIGRLVLKTINEHDQIQITNERNKELLLQSCLLVISAVPHNCNLLGIKLSQLLQSYTDNAHILSCVLEIVRAVKEANAKAISKFKLERIIPKILCLLLTSMNDELNQVCINLVQQLWGDQSPYRPVVESNSRLFLEILRSEIVFLTNSYRPNVSEFTLSFIIDLGVAGKVPPQWIKLLWIKYEQEKKVASLCALILPQQNIRRSRLLKLRGVEAEPSKKESKQSINQLNKQDMRQEKKGQQSNIDGANSQIQQGSKQILDDPIVLNPTAGSHQPKLTIQGHVVEPLEPVSSEETVQTTNLKSKSLGRKKMAFIKEEQSSLVHNMKGFITYIDSLANAELNQDQLQELFVALAYAENAISTHSYYCQRAVHLGLVTKCLNLNEKTQTQALDKILSLFVVMSASKEKNLLIFHEGKSIDFLKRHLKTSIDLRKELPTTKEIILIVKNCWSSSNEFYMGGLLSMLFEMCKLSLNRTQVLEMLAESQLSYEIMNEIYQRGLFSMMASTLAIENKKLNQEDKTEICLWARVIGKVCLNASIREKMYAIQVHILTWNKLSVFVERGCVQNLAFLYASFTYQFQKIANWAIKQQIPEYFQSHIKSYVSVVPFQFYKFYRYFSQNGIEFVVHLFRIKLQEHLIEILPVLSLKLKYEGYKDYYKCFSHLFVQEYYQFFIKAELIRALVAKYDQEHNSHALECLEKLVSQLQDQKQLEALTKQNFFSINTVFNSKVKDDLSYQHVLQIYITLFKKFKKFDHIHINLELVNKIIRKSIFSINMGGKKKTLQFLTQFSHVDKIYYGNANCLRLLQLLLAYNPTNDDLNLAYRYLDVESKYNMVPRLTEQIKGEEEEKYPLRFKKVVDVPCQNLLVSLFSKADELIKQIETITSEAKQKPQNTLNTIIKILKFFTKNEQNSIKIFEKVGTILIRTGYNLCSDEQSLNLINELLSWKSVSSRSPVLEELMLPYLHAVLSSNQKKSSPDKNLADLIDSVVQKCLKNKIFSLQQFTNLGIQHSKVLSQNPTLKKMASTNEQLSQKPRLSEGEKTKMKEGIKVKLFKLDGSNSSLNLFFTGDLFELHCATNITQTVKSKWKLPLIQISQMQEYLSQDQFKKSVFYLAEGVFTKAPNMCCCLRLVGKSNNFYVCFESPEQLKQWKGYIGKAKQEVKSILTKLS